jgi:hypothetical protein
MSEYQYYELIAIDRPLSERDVRELRTLSTRATITTTSFVNSYEWGDFRGNPARLMERYFDAFLYLANWRSYQIMLRLPRNSSNIKIAQEYCRGGASQVRRHRDYLIFEFCSEDEDGDDWTITGESILSSIIPIRAAIAGGDLRALYLSWLLCVQLGEVADDSREPPVPPGLAVLTGSLNSFAEFLRIDSDLIAVAAENNEDVTAPEGTQKELKAWIAGLSSKEKNALLLKAASEGSAGIGTLLRKQFRRDLEEKPPRTLDSKNRRTVGELLAAAHQRRESRRRRTERREQAARNKVLHALAKREAAAWTSVDALIAAKKPAEYDEAAELLVDLRDLAIQEKRTDEFDRRIEEIRRRHAKKPTFLSRLVRAGL